MGDIGLSFITPAPEVEADFFLQMARKTEEIGLHSFWINDRIVYDNFEPLTALAAAAAVTQQIRLGTSVLLAPVRRPVLLAKSLATIDFLSKGRLILGVGVGNRTSDYEAVHVPFERRGSRVLESIQLMRRLWQEDCVSFEGNFFRVQEIALGPKPFAKRLIPIWIGGSAEAVLKRAAHFADGYFCSTSALRNFPTIWEKISAHARHKGRDPDEIEKAALNFIAIDENKSRAIAACNAYFTRYYGKAPENVESHMIVGPADACAERIAELFKIGIRILVLGLIVPELRQLDILATNILPQLKRPR